MFPSSRSAAAKRRAGPSSRRGYTLVEVMISLVVVVFALGAMTRAIGTAGHLSETNRERALAQAAARRMLEELQGVPFDEVFARYNETGADDPGGAGTAAGAGFGVAGLVPQEGDGDGLAGEILLPAESANPGELREDVDLPRLGMPSDLNGDGAVDALDHSGDYRRLPVLVRIAWRGGTGNRTLDFLTVLVDRP